jgi:thioredoxin-related protein
MKYVFLFITLFIISTSLYSQDQPYNPNQDVRADLKKAVTLARELNKHVLVQFGGNWCPWCIRFHALARGAHPVDSLIGADYIYVLANVPKEKNKRDFDLFREYGYPTVLATRYL